MKASDVALDWTFTALAAIGAVVLIAVIAAVDLIGWLRSLFHFPQPKKDSSSEDGSDG